MSGMGNPSYYQPRLSPALFFADRPYCPQRQAHAKEMISDRGGGRAWRIWRGVANVVKATSAAWAVTISRCRQMVSSA